MIKFTSILFIFFILNNCGNYEFVYSIDKNLRLLTDNTNISVSGEDSDKVYIALKEVVGDKEEANFKYKLLVNSLKEESALVTNKDGTASKFKTQYLISYNLYNVEKKCIVFFKEIKTSNTYDAKSEGYSFGTDLFKNESSIENINQNINEFIHKVNNVKKINDCVN